MHKHQKVMAILGLINDYKERAYFQASSGSKVEWDDERCTTELDELLKAIKELIER